MTVTDADGIRRLRDLTGFGMPDCRRAFETADACGGDVLVALAVLHRAGTAIHRKDDRDAWNLGGAAAQANRWRAAIPGLKEAFPPRAAGAPATPLVPDPAKPDA